MTAPINQPMEVYAEHNVDPIGTIGMPTRDHIAAATMTSWLMTDFRWAGGRPITRVIVQGNAIPSQRNECIHNMQGDWIIFIDDDMVWSSSAIGDLVATYNQLKEEVSEPIILGGLCVRRAPPHQPTLYVRDGKGTFNFLEDWEGDVIEIDATGAAFYLIETRVFEAIMGGPFLPLEERKLLPPWPYYEWVGRMGEDLRFCNIAKEAGARIFVDTRIRIGHLSERAVDITDFWRHVAERGETVDMLRKEINDSMGLPSLTMKHAKERLDE